MTRLLLLVEGPTEERFVKQVLGPHLLEFNVFASATIVWTKRLPSGGGFQGGGRRFKKYDESLRPLLRDSTAWITTIVDYYALPEGFPGTDEAARKPAVREKVAVLETAWKKLVGDHPRFIPFLSLHEFETWLFAAPDVVATHFGEPDVEETLKSMVQEAGEPELVNDGPDTHSSARIETLLPQFGKTADGPVILEKTGLKRVRETCPNFQSWLTRLEGLGNP